jgi:hypothetical protein
MDDGGAGHWVAQHGRWWRCSPGQLVMTGEARQGQGRHAAQVAVSDEGQGQGRHAAQVADITHTQCPSAMWVMVNCAALPAPCFTMLPHHALSQWQVAASGLWHACRVQSNWCPRACCAAPTYPRPCMHQSCGWWLIQRDAGVHW